MFIRDLLGLKGFLVDEAHLASLPARIHPRDRRILSIHAKGHEGISIEGHAISITMSFGCYGWSSDVRICIYR